MVRTVGVTWAALDGRAEDAAMSLGATRRQAFRTVTLPALGPSIASAAVLVFLFCATSFGIIVVLGNGALNTLETEIYRQTVDLLDLQTAAVLSVVQIALVTGALAGAAAMRRRTERTLRLRAAPDPGHPLRRGDIGVVVIGLLMAVLLVAPLVTLLVRSLRTSDGWSLANYAGLATTGPRGAFAVTGWEALGNSLRMAGLAALLAVSTALLLSVVLARRPRDPRARRVIGVLDGLFMLPLGVSAATVGFGLLIALDQPPLDLRTSPWLIPIAQALVAAPLVVRLILPTLRGIDDRLRQAAGMLGASPTKVWLTVDLPLIGPALAGAGGDRVRGGVGRVRRDELPVPAGEHDAADPDRPADHPARPGQRRDGVRGRRRAGPDLRRGGRRGRPVRRQGVRFRGDGVTSHSPSGGLVSRRRQRQLRRDGRRRRRQSGGAARPACSRCSDRRAVASRRCSGRSPGSSRWPPGASRSAARTSPECRCTGGSSG